MTTANPIDTEQSLVLEQLLRARHSCRAYRPEQVPRDVITRLLTIAQRSASWCNTQPWQAIITEGRATERFRTALEDHVRSTGPSNAFDYSAPESYEGIYLERRREAGWQLYGAVGIERGDRTGSARQAMENFRLFGAPHVAIITSDARQGTYGAVDAGVYIGTFLLAAQALGLGAIAQAAIAGQAPFVRDHFQIPEDRKVLVGISFGYPDTAHPANSYRTSRAAIEDVATFVDR
ncbi:MAG: nitroreductase [Tetrasphaera sp.]